MTSTIALSPTLAAAAERLERLTAQDGWSREKLDHWQRERVRELVAYAVEHSPFYRRRLGPDAPHRPLGILPSVEKADLMADPEAVLTGPLPDGTVSLATGGSSRVRGTFHYTSAEWCWVLAAAMRAFQLIGVPPGTRSAFVVADSEDNMGAQISRDLGAGAPNQRFDPTRPLPQLAAELESYQPQFLTGYASALAVLAGEQLAGRLRIAPRMVASTSEPRTPEMADRMRAAWGVEPFDMYAATEVGPLALDCDRHRGLHVMDGLVVLEVVDAEDRPVAPGETGERVLLTALHRQLQPVIRYVLLDRVRAATDPCPCGRPHRLITAVEGRVDDVLMLPGPVHPSAFVPVAELPGVREFQIVQRKTRLHVAVVPTPEADPARLASQAEHTVADILAHAGARTEAIHVTIADQLDRTAAGKLRLVRRES
jgi:phenylacetate-coenzyme A ligase PaaK-like adenylate-forming protein